MMDGRKRRSQRTRERILTGAREVFLERGYSGSSMKAIALRAGVTQSLLHHHFGMKKSLWTEVQETGFHEVLKALRPEMSRAIGSPDFPVVLFKSYFNYLREHPDYVRLLGWTYVSGDGLEQALPGQATQLVEVFRRLQAQGKLSRKVEASICLTMIWALAEGWFLGRRDYERRLGQFSGGESMVEDYCTGAIRMIRQTLYDGAPKTD